VREDMGLYRGKKSEGAIWVEGYYLKINSTHYILTADNYLFSVDPNTVGQFTGVEDRNGVRIFEQDIVRGKDELVKDITIFGVVAHKNGSFVIDGGSITHYRWLDYDVEVVGTMSDNPELMEELE